MKKIFLFLYLIPTANLFGQSTSNLVSKDPIFIEFSSFLKEYYSGESDSAIAKKNSITKYKVVYSSEGSFIDTKHELIRLCNYKNIKKENYLAEVLYLEHVQDSLRSYFGKNSCETIKTSIINNYFGDALEDSLVNIYSNPSFWASCVGAKEIKFSPMALKSHVFNSINTNSNFLSPSIISYKGGKYLIVDIMMVTQIGNQTDSGYNLTLYLERLE